MPRQAFVHALLSHTHYLLAGAVEAGEFLLRSHTETLPFSLSLPLSLRGDLYLCISKQTQSAPTNSISCGRPLPNFPLLYSSLSLSPSLLLLHVHSYPLPAFSLLSDIDFYLSSHSFSPLLPFNLYPHFVLQSSRKAELFRITVIPHRSHSVLLLAMPKSFRTSPILH